MCGADGIPLCTHNELLRERKRFLPLLRNQLLLEA